jgi:hypothetical protein
MDVRGAALMMAANIVADFSVQRSSMMEAIARHPNREHFALGFVVGLLLAWMLTLLWRSGRRGC